MSDKVRDYKEGRQEEETRGHFRMMAARLVYQSIYSRSKDRRKCRCRLLVSPSPPETYGFLTTQCFGAFYFRFCVTSHSANTGIRT